MAYVGFGLFLLGIIFVILAPINKRKNSRCSEQTQGILQDIRTRYNSKGFTGLMYYYSYFVNGVEYKIKSPVLSPGAGNIGDSCEIWYNPGNPKDAQPFHYESNKAYRIILIIGIAMILLGLVLALLGLVLPSL